MDQLFVNIKQGILNIFATFLPDSLVTLISMFITVAFIIFAASTIMMYLTLIERKVLGRMQNRIGPNRTGKWGIFQPLADGIKMFTKEDIVPRDADKTLHLLAPLVIIIPALLIFSVIPVGRKMIAVDLNVGLLFFIAVSSTTTIAIFMASWGSRNKYSLLGGMRAVAQIVSYEVPMVLALVPVIMMTGTLSTRAIVEAQAGWNGFQWFVLTPWGFCACIMFFMCGVAEVNRTPFDLPEGESEIIAGFHTEYTGMKFALFYMAEFMNMFTISALCVTLFLGGWQGALLPSWLWFSIKTFFVIFIMIWFRGTLPRFRIDQLLSLAWKFFLPLALVNILATGFWHFTAGFVRVVGTCAILIATYVLLTYLNRAYTPQRRQYQLAD